MKISALSALADNYIWAIHNEHYCVVIDPGDAAPVIDFCNAKQLTLAAILITHHHCDHIGGIGELVKYFQAFVYGPKNPHITHPVKENDSIFIPEINLKFHVLETPGHTKDHIAYVTDKILFSGDTLFSAGCGRIFEGTSKQMYASLCKLKNLPDKTAVYCAHEYTLNNLKFAAAVEPHNLEIQHYRSACQSKTNTLPSTIAQEKKINPFLRCNQQSVIDAATTHTKQLPKNPGEVFKILRRWKDHF